MTRSRLAAFVQGGLRRLGYQITRAGPDGWNPDNLRKPGLAPTTVVDIGVGSGTAELYAAFPNSYLVLIEPLQEFEHLLMGVLAERPGEYLLTAIGASKGTKRLNVDPNCLMRSSLGERSQLTAARYALATREVTVSTLDDLFQERRWEPPFGLKIDTEGFELDVVQGATHFLRQTQFVIAEVSVAERFVGGYSFAEFVGAMDAHGFRCCDILAAPRSRQKELVFVDAFFRRQH